MAFGASHAPNVAFGALDATNATLGRSPRFTDALAAPAYDVLSPDELGEPIARTSNTGR